MEDMERDTFDRNERVLPWKRIMSAGMSEKQLLKWINCLPIRLKTYSQTVKNSNRIIPLNECVRGEKV